MEEIEKLRLQYAKAFYRMLGEYVKGEMSKIMILDHLKEYLRILEKRRKRKKFLELFDEELYRNL